MVRGSRKRSRNGSKRRVGKCTGGIAKCNVVRDKGYGVCAKGNGLCAKSKTARAKGSGGRPYDFLQSAVHTIAASICNMEKVVCRMSERIGSTDQAVRNMALGLQQQTQRMQRLDRRVGCLERRAPDGPARSAAARAPRPACPMLCPQLHPAVAAAANCAPEAFLAPDVPVVSACPLASSLSASSHCGQQHCSRNVSFCLANTGADCQALSANNPATAACVKRACASRASVAGQGFHRASSLSAVAGQFKPPLLSFPAPAAPCARSRSVSLSNSSTTSVACTKRRSSGSIRCVSCTASQDRLRLCQEEFTDAMGRHLLVVAHEGRTEDVRRLLDAGVDVDYTSSSKWTPLHRAAAKAHAGTVSLLLQRGASVKATTSYGFTPLHMAASNDFSGECVMYLIAAGSNIDSWNRSGQTPLHLAAECGNSEAVAALVAAGAATTAKDDDGRTAFDVAKTNCILRLLSNCGMRPGPRAACPPVRRRSRKRSCG